MQKRSSKRNKEPVVVYAPMLDDSGIKMYEDIQPIDLPLDEEISRLHYHHQFEVGVVVEGEGLFLSGGQVQSVRAGDIIFVAPSVLHYSKSIGSDEMCKCKFVYLDADSLLKYLGVDSEVKAEKIYSIAKQIPLTIRKSENERAYYILKDLFLEEVYTNEKSVFLRVALFLNEAEFLFPQIETTKILPNIKVDDKIAKIAEKLYLGYNEEVSVVELAKESFLSESQFRKKFVKAYGVSPVQFRNRVRIMVATELLKRNDVTVSQICDKIGYTTLSEFYRAFKKEKGVSPQEYKKSSTAD